MPKDKKKKRIMRAFKMFEISAVDRPAQAEAKAVIMKRADITKSAVEDGKQRVKKKETNMSDTKTAADIQKAADEKLAKVQDQLDAANKVLDVANKVNALGSVVKAHYDTLGDEDKTSFLAKSADDQNTDVEVAKKAAADLNPVVYTAGDGSEYRKNDDHRLVAMAKQADDDRKENAKLRKAAADADLRKRAETDLSNLPGSIEAHMALLKSAESIEDEKLRNEAITTLKAKNESLESAFSDVGSGIAPTGNGTPLGELNDLSKAYAEKHNVSEAVAQDEVLKTDAGSKLYAKAYN